MRTSKFVAKTQFLCHFDIIDKGVGRSNYQLPVHQGVSLQETSLLDGQISYCKEPKLIMFFFSFLSFKFSYFDIKGTV